MASSLPSGGPPGNPKVAASGTTTVTMISSKGASFGDHQAKLCVKIGVTEVAHAAVYTRIK